MKLASEVHSMQGCSPLAARADRLRRSRPRPGALWGAAVHMPGQDVVREALRRGVDPLEHLANRYLDLKYFPHYTIGYDGRIVQVCDEAQVAEHIGFEPWDRLAFLRGAWKDRLPPTLIALWQRHWPTYRSPAHLFPGQSPNEVYVGVEVIPIVAGVDARPMAPGLRHTTEQHQAVAALGRDIAERWKFPLSWHRTGRLVGHEDVNPLQRSTRNPPAGWDPGFLRPEKDRWFDFEDVRRRLDAARGDAPGNAA